ncbi:MAG: ParB/RepB/Spo0J family partition protein [Gemmatimonadetes bacterium]|nr:ParB/RepB/Spo0J family partition protein [Gemmatimonadota bacterium]MYH53061.1 ParB/RepB/Spo0J family partition protein [Gemmatimonadota bacterium]MYK67937.1 ParB/RepB/Spo0J family partition protein [Gemmatimonadota bacterium]
MSRNDRLGRGLSALLGEYAGEPLGSGVESAAPMKLPVRTIAPNPFQPRTSFVAVELEELAASIKANGLLQAIVVRRSVTGRTFELVAGERRLRAVKQLGWREIPAQIRDVDDQTLLVLALVENLQRQDLGPLEEAKGYESLRDTFGYSQRQIGEAVGKSRSTVANMLRLLTLPPSVRRLVEEGDLSMGHGRAILGVDDPVKAADLARQAVANDWSVRETERRIRELQPGDVKPTDPDPANTSERDPAIDVLEESLGAHLGARVAIQWKGKGTGAIRIAFRGVRDLERVFEAVTGTEAAEVVG